MLQVRPAAVCAEAEVKKVSGTVSALTNAF
jgi:hypothetical protein